MYIYSLHFTASTEIHDKVYSLHLTASSSDTWYSVYTLFISQPVLRYMIKCTSFVSQPVVRYLVQCIYTPFISQPVVRYLVYTVYTPFISQPVVRYLVYSVYSLHPMHCHNTWNIVYTPSSSHIPGAVSSFCEEVDHSFNRNTSWHWLKEMMVFIHY